MSFIQKALSVRLILLALIVLASPGAASCPTELIAVSETFQPAEPARASTASLAQDPNGSGWTDDQLQALRQIHATLAAAKAASNTAAAKSADVNVKLAEAGELLAKALALQREASSLVLEATTASTRAHVEMVAAGAGLIEFASNPPTGGGDPGNGDPGNGDPGNGDPGNGDPGNGDPGNGDPTTYDPLQEPNAHAAATRTAEQNKRHYLSLGQANRSTFPAKEEVVLTSTFSEGTAPDMADYDIGARWQWALNSSRGGWSSANPGGQEKTGHVDLARLRIHPARDDQVSGPFYPSLGMKWGMRRYNLADVTVTDCDFLDIPQEHGCYDNVSGHGLYLRNTFENIGGQALQIAYRPAPYAQYDADNLPFTGQPTFFIDGCHAVDTGLFTARSSSTYTFFDPGNREFPGIIVIRDTSSTMDWREWKHQGLGTIVSKDDPAAIRSSAALVVTHYYERTGDRDACPTEWVVLDNVMFDYTGNRKPFVALRGVSRTLIEDSCFLARESWNPYVHLDDEWNKPGKESPCGTIVIENCVSPPDAEVFLKIGGQVVCSMNCPGKRLEIDCTTLEVVEKPVQYDRITDLQSPLFERTKNIASGTTPQPAGHVDDMGAVPFKYRRADPTKAAGGGVTPALTR